MSELSSTKAMKVLQFQHGVHTACLQHLPYDLSSRQMSILLSVYLSATPQSVRDLSEQLSISKPAICRALDMLERAKLLKRSRAKDDKRSVLLQRTVKGSVFLTEYAELVLKVSKSAA